MKKQTINTYITFLTGFMLLTFLGLFPPLHVNAADTDIHSIDIHVTLNNDGSADITEVWDITMTSGTEWYLVQGNLGKIKIQDFSVSDETGLVYEYIDDWNVNRSLEEKAGKCGIVYQGDGTYELCFGIGSYGQHQFTVSYHMTNFIKGFKDYCGFNQRFVNDKLSGWVDRVSVTIEKPGTAFTPEDTKVWAFGFTGSIHVTEGIVYAESDSPLKFNNYVNIMCRFPRDMFATENLVRSSFDSMKDTALEESDYDKDTGSFSMRAFILKALLYAGAALLFILFIAATMFSCKRRNRSASTTFEESNMLIESWSQKKFTKAPSFWILAAALLFFLHFTGIIIVLLLIFKGTKGKPVPCPASGRAYLPSQLKEEAGKNQTYYRDIPLDGNIAALYAALSFTNITNGESHVLGAYLLKWLLQGKIEIKNTKKAGLRGALGAEVPSIILLSPPDPNAALESGLYDMLLKASGNDNILQEKEMYKWSKENYSIYRAWLMNVEATGKNTLYRSQYIGHIYQPSSFSISLNKEDAFTEAGRQEFLHLYGFLNFLKDFTLMQEREPVEVTLWDNYLIAAQLFGMADKVAETFEKLNPYHFKDSGYNYDNNFTSAFIVLNSISHASTNGMRRGSSSSGYSSSSGGGGSSSSGGGGGYSGGGSGGGGR